LESVVSADTLFHDLGKATSHEQEGSHALVGARFARKHGEEPLIVNAIASHHEEEAPTGVIAHLVAAADALSGARPGARREMLESYVKRLENLENEIPLRHVPELASASVLRGYAFLSAKPVLVLFNNEDEDEDRPKEITPETEGETMVIRGKLEQELAQMTDEEAAEFLAAFSITASAMDRVLKRSYDLLGLISFFTVGEDEVRAWTIRKDTDAVDAADVIHSDIKKGFIRAEVVAYDDLMDAGSHAEARKRGTVRLEGKTYKVRNGDIINFRFNV